MMIGINIGYAMVVDDEPANREFAERLLQLASFSVKGASTGAEALANGSYRLTRQRPVAGEARDSKASRLSGRDQVTFPR